MPRRRVVIAILALALALLGVGGKGYWVWTHPTLFKDLGVITRFGPTPLKNAVVYGAVAYGPEDSKHDETITLHSVIAHFTTNTAHATATFMICDSNESNSTADSLAAPDSPTKYCRSLRPVTNGMKVRLRFDGPQNKAEYVIMRLKATTAGTAHIDWLAFDYTRSWRHLDQHGSDRSNQDWTLTVTP